MSPTGDAMALRASDEMTLSVGEQRIQSLAKNRVFYMDPADADDPNAFDDFYSPIEPESYIRHRVLSQLHFYQSRCAGLLLPLIMMIIAELF